ncbi:MAG TPA: hypothetical protein VFV19_15310 [Candidatus Polarisedimenticolaceae bacterium]|nr:hypothetical protein [Candidatus Polarisedimenticolaceae bacterium]
MRRIILELAIVAAAALMPPATSASCIPDKSASTFNPITGVYAYWHSTTTDGTVSGLSWQLGAPGTWNSNGGVVNCSTFSWMYINAQGINVNLSLGSCGAGCPSNGSTLAVLAQHQPQFGGKTNFLLATIAETPASAINFDYGTQGDHDLIELPRPRVLSSMRGTGGAINLNLSLPSVEAGFYGPNAASAVTGYVVRSVKSPTTPCRDASCYPTVLGTFPAPGGVATTGVVAADCSDLGTDDWIATQLSFEGGAIVSTSVSQPIRLLCNPALADPKYKIVPKRHETTLDH